MRGWRESSAVRPTASFNIAFDANENLESGVVSLSVWSAAEDSF